MIHSSPPVLYRKGLTLPCCGPSPQVTSVSVACSTETTIEENRMAVMTAEEKMTGGKGTVGANGWALFPEAANWVEKGFNGYVHS